MTVTGSGFVPEPHSNVVLFEQARAQVSEASTVALKVSVGQCGSVGLVLFPGDVGESTTGLNGYPPLVERG